MIRTALETLIAGKTYNTQRMGDVKYLDSTHVVIVYADYNVGTSTGFVKAVCGTLSGDTVTWGSAVIVSNVAPPLSMDDVADIIALDSTHIVIAYGKYTGNGYCIAGTVSGTTITLGSEVLFKTASSVDTINIDKVDSTTFILAYAYSSEYTGYVHAGTISGTTVTITANAGTQYETGSIAGNTVLMMDATNFLICFIDSGDSNKLKVRTGSLSGVAITMGVAASNITTVAVSTDSEAPFSKLSSSKAIAGYERSSVYYAKVIGLAGGVITVNAEQTVLNADTSNRNLYALDSTYIAFGYVIGTATRVLMGKVSDSTLTMTSNYGAVTSNSSEYIRIVAGASQVVIVYKSDLDDGFYFNIDNSPVSAEMSFWMGITDVAKTSFTGNGSIWNPGFDKCTTRGFCYKVYDGSDPTTADSTVSTAGSFGRSNYNQSVTPLTANTQYSTRAYAINSEGTYYSTTVNQYTGGVTNPTYAYADDANYMTRNNLTTGVIKVKLSKDGGSTWSNELSNTYTGAEEYQSYGTGTSETWGLSWVGSEINSATLFKLRITFGNVTAANQDYAGWGFAVGASAIINGIHVEVKAYYSSGVGYVNYVRITAWMGTSLLPIVAGSVTYASNGRKVGEGAGAGTGCPVYYSVSNWYRYGDDTVVAA